MTAESMETDSASELPPGEVVVLQPYGAIFFATASILLDQMPTVTPSSRNSVVILRVRGADDAGATMLDVLAQYARTLNEVDSRLMIVTNNEHVIVLGLTLCRCLLLESASMGGFSIVP